MNWLLVGHTQKVLRLSLNASIILLLYKTMQVVSLYPSVMEYQPPYITRWGKGGGGIVFFKMSIRRVS